MKIMMNFLLLLLSLSASSFASADELNMSVVSTNVLSMTDMLSNLIFGLCYVMGITLAFMTLIFFRRYKQNPVETPLSKIFWTFFLAVVIFLLPFVARTMGIYQEMEDASEQSPTAVN
jgi:ABC-type spermidine/putrescine transport system permease subunit II